MDEDTLNDGASEQLAQAAKTIKALGEFAKRLASTNMRQRAIVFEIDGLRYTSTKLAATVGLELLPRITALFGSAFTRAMATGDLGGISPDVFVRVADRAMRDGLWPLVRALLERMEVNELAGIKEPGNVLDDFDDHFAGEYMHLLRVCLFALAHNFRGPALGAS